MTSARFLTFLWLIATLVALGWPGEALPDAPFVGIDKLVHVAIFAIGTVLALKGWPENAGLVLAALLVFAPLTEVWQAVLPTERDASVFDAIANAIGIAVGWMVWRLVGSGASARGT